MPDIIIEDNSFSTPLIAEKNNIPRISIHRTGFFRSISSIHKNDNHKHSIEDKLGSNDTDVISFIKSNKLDLSIPENRIDINFLKNYVNSKAKLIPGIPSIEVLPKSIKNRDSYFYTGPLTVEDNPSQELIKKLSSFFEINNQRKVVFITTGLIDQSEIKPLIDILFTNGYAVISTSNIFVEDKYSRMYYQNSILPLNYICSKVDLVIHQCGSGMYHYPILNEKPTITIGTQCYDREDVAIRLEQLKVSKHTPHPNDNNDYLNIFTQHLENFKNSTLCDFTKLKELKEEIYSTMLNFDMEEVIKYTLK